MKQLYLYVFLSLRNLDSQIHRDRRALETLLCEYFNVDIPDKVLHLYVVYIRMKGDTQKNCVPP